MNFHRQLRRISACTPAAAAAQRCSHILDNCICSFGLSLYLIQGHSRARIKVKRAHGVTTLHPENPQRKTSKRTKTRIWTKLAKRNKIKVISGLCSASLKTHIPKLPYGVADHEAPHHIQICVAYTEDLQDLLISAVPTAQGSNNECLHRGAVSLARQLISQGPILR